MNDGVIHGQVRIGTGPKEGQLDRADLVALASGAIAKVDGLGRIAGETEPVVGRRVEAHTRFQLRRGVVLGVVVGDLVGDLCGRQRGAINLPGVAVEIGGARGNRPRKSHSRREGIGISGVHVVATYRRVVIAKENLGRRVGGIACGVVGVGAQPHPITHVAVEGAWSWAVQKLGGVGVGLLPGGGATTAAGHGGRDGGRVEHDGGAHRLASRAVLDGVVNGDLVRRAFEAGVRVEEQRAAGRELELAQGGGERAATFAGAAGGEAAIQLDAGRVQRGGAGGGHVVDQQVDRGDVGAVVQRGGVVVVVIGEEVRVADKIAVGINDWVAGGIELEVDA